MSKRKKRPRLITRNCSICGREINIVLLPNHKYQGGHFFCRLRLPDGTKAEYWECDSCFYEDPIRG